MYDWLSGNWIWILLGLGALWFVFRGGGMRCGMGGHGHDEADPAVKKLDANVEKSSRTDDGKTAGHPGASHGSHRHGGCC